LQLSRVELEEMVLKELKETRLEEAPVTSPKSSSRAETKSEPTEEFAELVAR
jgi:hypothetical protein